MRHDPQTCAPDFFSFARDYLHTYMPTIRGLSPKTIEAYRISLECFLAFLTDHEHIDRAKVNFDHFGRERLKAWMAWLADDKHYATRSITLRLSAIKAFLAYAAAEDIALIALSQAARTLKATPAPRKPIEYLTEAETRAVLSAFTGRTAKSRRNRMLLILAPLGDRVWVVADDVHELGPEALRQLELLIMRAPPGLRFVLATRHDVPLGLHRLRLEGGLAEIREPDLRFTVAEARELFAAAGVDLPDLAPLVERTEGWAAGLRLAALSLEGHPDPERLAAEFSGSERTVAEYLLAEVLDRQGEAVRRLLLRTSILERVNGELADLLTGDSGGERVLQDLEAANAFVVALDTRRLWFRYHHLFADLLQLELCRTAPNQVAGLHRAATGWFAGHGYPVEAVRHAQAAQDWDLARRLLADRWPGLYLDGQAVVIYELLGGFPAEQLVADAELAAVAAGQLSVVSPIMRQIDAPSVLSHQVKGAGASSWRDADPDASHSRSLPRSG